MQENDEKKSKILFNEIIDDLIRKKTSKENMLKIQIEKNKKNLLEKFYSLSNTPPSPIPNTQANPQPQIQNKDQKKDIIPNNINPLMQEGQKEYDEMREKYKNERNKKKSSIFKSEDLHISNTNSVHLKKEDYSPINPNMVGQETKNNILIIQKKLFGDNEETSKVENIDEIDDLDSYPKVFEFQYNYQHPVPNPVLFGPKLLQNTDNYKIIFISPICLIIEQKSDSTGFTGIDCFYTSIRCIYDMELNDELTIKKTLLNCYFGLNFTKSNWLQGKIKSSAFSQAEEGFTKKLIPALTKELNLTIKHYSKKSNVIKKISLRGKKTFSNGKSSILDDLIMNDSFISDSEDEKRKNLSLAYSADRCADHVGNVGSVYQLYRRHF